MVIEQHIRKKIHLQVIDHVVGMKKSYCRTKSIWTKSIDLKMRTKSIWTKSIAYPNKNKNSITDARTPQPREIFSTP